MNVKWHRVYTAAVLTGACYYFVRNIEFNAVLVVAWKGAGVVLLAVWCAGAARSLDGWLITGVMAISALGDVLIETQGVTAGALAFAAAHVLAMTVYLKNWQYRRSLSQQSWALPIVALSMLIAASLVPLKHVVVIVAYVFFVAGMAASAWTSRFPRSRVWIGAMMFLASDLLIVARMGPLARSWLPGLLIWPLYFAGQALIASGVVRTLRTDDIVSTP